MLSECVEFEVAHFYVSIGLIQPKTNLNLKVKEISFIDMINWYPSSNIFKRLMVKPIVMIRIKTYINDLRKWTSSSVILLICFLCVQKFILQESNSSRYQLKLANFQTMIFINKMTSSFFTYANTCTCEKYFNIFIPTTNHYLI